MTGPGSNAIFIFPRSQNMFFSLVSLSDNSGYEGGSHSRHSYGYRNISFATSQMMWFSARA